MDPEQKQDIIQEPQPVKKRVKKQKQNDEEDNIAEDDSQVIDKVRCQQCGKDIAKDHYKYHLKHVHGGVRHQCLYCPQNYADKSNLSHHVKDKHPDVEKMKRQPSYERNEICDTCNRGFKTQETLRVHKYNCLKILQRMNENDPKQSKLKFKQKKHGSVEDLEKLVKNDLLEEEKDAKNFGQLGQTILVTTLSEIQITSAALNTSFDNLGNINIDEGTMTYDQTEDPSMVKEFIKVQDNPQKQTKELKGLQWIPSADTVDFDKVFINEMYNAITKETDIMWPLDKLPDQNVPLAKSTRKQTAISDQQWDQSEDNLVKNAQVSIGYGEATQQSVDKIIGCFKDNGFNDSSIFLDIGSGFGKVVFHVAALTKAQCYGIEVHQARYSYSQQLLINLSQVIENPPLYEIVKRVHFDKKDAGKCAKFLDNEGRQITHVYCFNAVFSEVSNKEIATVIGRTPDIQMIAWCTDAVTTAKYGLKDFKQLVSYSIALQGSGNHRKMYIYKRQDELDESKLQMIRESGLSKELIQQITDKIESQQLKMNQLQEQIDSEHSQAIVDELLRMSNFISVNILALRKTMSVHQFVSEYQKSSKVKGGFYTNQSIRSNLLQLQKVTQYNWFKVESKGGIEMINRQGGNQQPASIREQIEQFYCINQSALTQQKVQINVDKIQLYILKAKEKIDEYEMKIKTLSETYEQMKSPYKAEHLQKSNEGLEVPDQEFLTIDLMLIGLDICSNPYIDWSYVNEDHKEKLNKVLIQLKDIEKEHRVILAKIAKFKQFTVQYVQVHNQTTQEIKELDDQLTQQVKNYLKVKHQIDPKNIKFISRGAYGRVYKVSKGQLNGFPTVGAPFAIKFCLKKGEETKQELQSLQKIHQQKTVNTNYVVKYLGSFTMMNGQAFILDYYPYNLAEVLQKKMLKNLQQINHVACFILRGINAAHALKISHRDIKPQNILMTKELVPAICDFGFTPLTVECGTVGYMAPELYTTKYVHKIDLLKTDAWSTGIVLYQLYNNNKRPFDNINEKDFATKSKTELQLTFDDGVPIEAQDLIRGLLVRDPSKRSTIAGAVNHKLFKGIQFFNNEIVDISHLL